MDIRSTRDGASVPGCHASEGNGSTPPGGSLGPRAANAGSEDGCENLMLNGHTSWDVSHLSRYVIPLPCGQYRKRTRSTKRRMPTSTCRNRGRRCGSRCLPDMTITLDQFSADRAFSSAATTEADRTRPGPQAPGAHPALAWDRAAHPPLISTPAPESLTPAPRQLHVAETPEMHLDFLSPASGRYGGGTACPAVEHPIQRPDAPESPVVPSRAG